MPSPEVVDTQLPEHCAGSRLDRAIANLLPDYSRNRIIQWLRDGSLLVDGEPGDPSTRARGGERIQLTLPPPDAGNVAPQALDLDVQFEDEDLLVINKPAGLVVHPGAGNPDGTLLNGLLHRLPELAALPRLGLVHRLDKDTSGLLIVARSERAHVELTRAMQAREIRREYLAVVKRVMTAGGSVDAAIARHKTDRKKMAVERQAGRGRRAVTHYQVLQRFRSHTSVRVQLETGRTHQIRVHMQHIGHPIAGDPVYGRGVRMPPLHNPASEAVVNAWRRQALHAQSLTFAHPVSGEALVFTAEVPADLQALLDALEKDRRS